jgi:hypothetical protein
VIQTIIMPANRTDAGHATRFLSALALDKPWRVEVSEYRPRRSDEQNRYLWGGVYRTICEHLEGWETADVHEYCLGECYGWETIEGLGRKRLRPVRRSSKLNKQEFSDYIAFIQRRMAEHGIYIPDPEQNEEAA